MAVDGRVAAGAAGRGTRLDRSQRRRQDDFFQFTHQVPASPPPVRFSTTAKTSPGKKPADIARRGIVRSFQICAVFPHLTVLENVRVALHAQTRYNRFISGVRKEA